MEDVPFVAFPKIARWSREVVVTEKLDGTNAQIHFTDAGRMLIGSRNRWIGAGDDNFGFGSWAVAHEEELRQLGPGSHFGEWWGVGIQRRYSTGEKRFSLFNVGRWGDGGKGKPPSCCHVVPVLYRGVNEEARILGALGDLRSGGSIASPGFMNPEGVVIFHAASRMLFKKTLEGDEMSKGEAEARAR